MSNRQTSERRRKPLPEGSPSRERQQHDEIDRVEKPIEDAAGMIGWPYTTRDIVAQMEKRGAITSEMRIAAEEFRSQFQRAHLVPLQAADYGRCPGGATVPDILHIETARNHVWHKLQQVGGLASPGGSCLWHVVGWELSLKAWALEQGWNGRFVSQEAASGILIAALGALAR